MLDRNARVKWLTLSLASLGAAAATYSATVLVADVCRLEERARSSNDFIRAHEHLRFDKRQ